MSIFEKYSNNLRYFIHEIIFIIYNEKQKK